MDIFLRQFTTSTCLNECLRGRVPTQVRQTLFSWLLTWASTVNYEVTKGSLSAMLQRTLWYKVPPLYGPSKRISNTWRPMHRMLGVSLIWLVCSSLLVCLDDSSRQTDLDLVGLETWSHSSERPSEAVLYTQVKSMSSMEKTSLPWSWWSRSWQQRDACLDIVQCKHNTI